MELGASPRRSHRSVAGLRRPPPLPGCAAPKTFRRGRAGVGTLAAMVRRISPGAAMSPTLTLTLALTLNATLTPTLTRTSLNDVGPGSLRREPPSPCRLPPAACRLPPAGRRLPPAACGLLSSPRPIRTRPFLPYTAERVRAPSLQGRTCSVFPQNHSHPPFPLTTDPDRDPDPDPDTDPDPDPDPNPDQVRCLSPRAAATARGGCGARRRAGCAGGAARGGGRAGRGPRAAARAQCRASAVRRNR